MSGWLGAKCLKISSRSSKYLLNEPIDKEDNGGKGAPFENGDDEEFLPAAETPPPPPLELLDKGESQQLPVDWGELEDWSLGDNTAESGGNEVRGESTEKGILELPETTPWPISMPPTLPPWSEPITPRLLLVLALAILIMRSSAEGVVAALNVGDWE